MTRASVTPTKAAPVTSAPPAAHCNPETPIVDVSTPHSPPALLSQEPSSSRSLESPRSKLLQKFKPADVVEESVAVEAKEEEDGPILSDRRTPRRKGSGGADLARHRARCGCTAGHRASISGRYRGGSPISSFCESRVNRGSIRPRYRAFENRRQKLDIEVCEKSVESKSKETTSYSENVRCSIGPAIRPPSSLLLT